VVAKEDVTDLDTGSIKPAAWLNTGHAKQTEFPVATIVTSVEPKILSQLGTYHISPIPLVDIARKSNGDYPTQCRKCRHKDE
jgi:hypothetical protein